MARILIKNRLNNMGDAMCQMRGLKEFKDNFVGNPLVIDFATDQYLHYLMATHTDLFATCRVMSFTELNRLPTASYDRVIEFDIDWSRACDIGILKAWTEKTLGFIPSTDQPYYLIRDEERIVAQAHAARSRKYGFDKLVLLQLNTPSGYVRSFREEDWNKVLDLFPENVALIYPGPLDLALECPMSPRRNLFLLPGYDMGTTAALLQEADYVFGAHGGIIMLAHAVGQKNVTQVMFKEGCEPGILHVPAWDNLFYPSHNEVNWEEVQQTITKRLTQPLPSS